jgi:hypothetical protein
MITRVAARLAFGVLAVTCVALLILMVPINLATFRLEPDFRSAYALVAPWVSRAGFAAYWLARDYAVALLCVITGLLITWRRAEDRTAWLAGAVLVTLPIIFSLGGYTETWAAYPLAWRRWLLLAREAATQVGIQAIVLFVFLFPTGRPATRWLGWLCGLFFLIEVPLVVWQWWSGAEIVFWVLLAALAIMLPIGVGGQAYRYRRQSTPLERQQTRWVVIGLGTWIVITVTGMGLVFGTQSSPSPRLAAFAAEQLAIFSVAAVPLTLAFSVLRYRLWDIDWIIRRTLLYTLLTGMLAGLYLGSVIVLQSLVTVLTGRLESPAATVASTLLIAAVAGPLRARIQHVIDRRFFRQRYDAARTLEAYSAGLRDEVAADLEGLQQRLVDVVQDTLEPQSVSLWLRR